MEFGYHLYGILVYLVLLRRVVARPAKEQDTVYGDEDDHGDLTSDVVGCTVCLVMNGVSGASYSQLNLLHRTLQITRKCVTYVRTHSCMMHGIAVRQI